MTQYVLIISEEFPLNHKKSGIPTFFIPQIMSISKMHTIRGNYKLWQKRFEKIAKGEACISIRKWTGKPYRSKQFEVLNLKNTDGISLQKLEFYEDKDGVPSIKYPLIDNLFCANIEFIAQNDGLSLIDFKEWFKNYDLSQPMAIIHFTHFKYNPLTQNINIVLQDAAIAWWNKVSGADRERLTKKYIFRVVNYEHGRYCDPLRVDEIIEIYQNEHNCK